LAVRYWCHTKTPNLRIKAWVDRESWWSASWYQQSLVGLNSKLILQPWVCSTTIMVQTTGPWSSKRGHASSQNWFRLF